jgi:hypothetical protein
MATTRKKSNAAGRQGRKPTPARTRGATPGRKAKDTTNLESLRRSVENAQALVEGAKKEAVKLQDQARELMVKAKATYREALAPYRDACRKAGVKCEFTGGRAANVSERVSFLVEKVDKGLKVTVRGSTATRRWARGKSSGTSRAASPTGSERH